MSAQNALLPTNKASNSSLVARRYFSSFLSLNPELLEGLLGQSEQETEHRIKQVQPRTINVNEQHACQNWLLCFLSKISPSHKSPFSPSFCLLRQAAGIHVFKKVSLEVDSVELPFSH